MKKIILSFLLIMSVICSINAQHLFNWGEKRNLTYLKYGIEPTFVLTGGYSRNFPIKITNPSTLFVFGEVSSPTRLLGIKNYECKIGSMLPILKKDNFGVTFMLNLSTGHVDTKNFSSQKFALGHKTLTGIFKTNWHLGFVVEYEYIMVNYIKNSDYYKYYIFPEAKDGWYKGAGGNFNLGFEYGYTFSNKIELNADFKIPRSMTFKSFYGSPAHLNVRLGYRF